MRVIDGSDQPSSTSWRAWRAISSETRGQTERRNCRGSQNAPCKHTRWRECLRSERCVGSAHSPCQLGCEPKPLTMAAGSALCLCTRNVWVHTSAEPTLVELVLTYSNTVSCANVCEVTCRREYAFSTSAVQRTQVTNYGCRECSVSTPEMSRCPHQPIEHSLTLSRHSNVVPCNKGVFRELILFFVQ